MLTERQRELLVAAEPQRGRTVTVIYKSGWPGTYWRSFDQLERRGLLELRTSGRYIITDAGRDALKTESVRITL